MLPCLCQSLIRASFAHRWLSVPLGAHVRELLKPTCESFPEAAGALRLDEKRNDLRMQLAHAALKLADFGLYFGRPEFVVEFQAERDYDLQRREMNRQNAIRVGNTLYLFREPQAPLDSA